MGYASWSTAPVVVSSAAAAATASAAVLLRMPLPQQLHSRDDHGDDHMVLMILYRCGCGCRLSDCRGQRPAQDRRPQYEDNDHDVDQGCCRRAAIVASTLSSSCLSFLTSKNSRKSSIKSSNLAWKHYRLHMNRAKRFTLPKTKC
jgi:hypothetical protein